MSDLINKQGSSSCTHENDLISRQAAIDAVEESRRLNHHQDGKEACAHEYEHRHFLKILKDLPSAQPNLQSTCNQLATDCISRQAAIDAMGVEPLAFSEYENGLHDKWEDDVKALMQLPSAQSEIIRCRDCRWRKDQSGSTAWLPCRAIVTPSDFSCCRAERRTDEQIR